MDDRAGIINMKETLPRVSQNMFYHPSTAAEESQRKRLTPKKAQPYLLACESLPDEPLMWLQQCLTWDTSCKAASDGGIRPFIPSRLIDLGPAKATDPPRPPRLVDAQEVDLLNSTYVALSHRWAERAGDCDGLELKTTTETLEKRKRGIDVDKLTKTFRFAIDICRWLDVRYVWIDSFCIVQDSERDWTAESAKMAQIYRNSHCAIAINIPETKEGPLWTHCGYEGRESSSGWAIDYVESKSWEAHSRNMWMGFLSGGLLGSRAWCLQERQLAPRMMHFIDPGMIMWECCCHAAAIGGPLVFGNEGHHSQESKPDDELRVVDTFRYRGGRFFRLEDVMKTWYRVLADYTSRSLTRETDRPVAIQGVVQLVIELTDYTYHHGLWDQHLTRGLLWERNHSVGESWSRCEGVPTWSWLSVRGPIMDPAGNDEKSNPPFFEDTRTFRPLFDHSYESFASSISVCDGGESVQLQAPVVWGRLEYEQSKPDATQRGLKVAITRRAGWFSMGTIGWASMDLPQEGFYGEVALVLLTASYGLLLQTVDKCGIYRRLGVVRHPRKNGVFAWKRNMLPSPELLTII